MSKPDDIPQDVWDAARLSIGEWSLAANISGLDEIIITEGIARAIMAERGRCHGIAWKHGASATDPHESNAGYLIANAIRSGAN